jgi:predicted  nucleic acid-binding Zn-ribbon protein
MKSCTKCGKSFSDDTLNFCLECGSQLLPQTTQNQNAATIFINQPLPTENVGFRDQKQNFIPSQTPAKPKSRAWIWILGIFGALAVFGGIVMIALIAFVSSISNENIAKQNSNKIKEIANLTKDNKVSDGRKDVLIDDLSKWTFSDSTIGKSVYEANALDMSSIDNRHYFMLSTPNTKSRTENATVKVSVRNSQNQSSEIGYGLLIHCDELKPGKKDYAFLIDSKNGRYRILRHKDTNETEIVRWTKSSAVIVGSEINDLEVSDSNGSMSFKINGQLVKTIKESDGNNNGIVGLYTGTGFAISFSNLEISK